MKAEACQNQEKKESPYHPAFIGAQEESSKIKVELDSDRESLNSEGMEKPDQLSELFRMQKALNQRIGVNTDQFNEEDKTK